MLLWWCIMVLCCFHPVSVSLHHTVQLSPMQLSQLLRWKKLRIRPLLTVVLASHLLFLYWSYWKSDESFLLKYCVLCFITEHFYLPGSALTYLDAASHQIGHVLLTAALKPMKDEVPILFHLDREEERNRFAFIFMEMVDVGIVAFLLLHSRVTLAEGINSMSKI